MSERSSFFILIAYVTERGASEVALPLLLISSLPFLVPMVNVGLSPQLDTISRHLPVTGRKSIRSVARYSPLLLFTCLRGSARIRRIRHGLWSV